MNVVCENIKAIDCRHIVRTANSPRGHANLVLRNLVGTRCERPVVISHTDNVVLDGVCIEEHANDAGVPVELRNCHGVSIQGLAVAEGDYVGDRLQLKQCTQVTVREAEATDAVRTERP